ncbi:MAG: hypothetical protein DHS20C14_08320 [Phycisphaeraceae bacterium]|nr:MAG: hypothetical protein DHS20C14_08320 [Phycisphaeraceae bacterium]
MECKTCGYSLWNLPDRTCPECGSGFKPSDFNFRLGTVRFHCPHCQQAYYGTDANGHLVPRAFDCVSCSRHIHMDETLLLPAEGVSESGTIAHEQPWLDRPNRGFFRAWWKTVTMSLFQPISLMKGTPPGSPLGRAWGFAVVNLALIFGATLAITVVCMGALAAMVANAQGGAAGLGPMMVFQLVSQVGFFVGFAIYVALWILSAHATLRVTGGSKHTMRVTAQAILYASGTYSISLIPCVGGFAMVWWIVSAILMLAAGQGVSGGRATLAVLLLPVLTILAFVGMYAAFMYAVFASMNTAFAANNFSLEALALSAQNRAADRGAGWDETDHGLLLLTDGYTQAWTYTSMDFARAAMATQPADIPAGPGTLADYSNPSTAQLNNLAASLPALPPNVVAHRVGDFVFTYHGIDAAAAPPGLWIIVEHELADAGFGSEELTAITTDGITETMPPWTRQEQVDAQNDIRALHGLAPLPDPAMVTQDQPATADP